MVKYVTDADIGNGLEIAGNKLQLKIDTNTLEVLPDGTLKAKVSADIHLNNVTRQGTVLTFDMNEGDDKTLDLADLVPDGSDLLATTPNNLLKATPDGKLQVLPENLRGEEVRSLDNTLLGYLLPAA